MHPRAGSGAWLDILHRSVNVHLSACAGRESDWCGRGWWKDWKEEEDDGEEKLAGNVGNLHC